MASLITHAVAGAALGQVGDSEWRKDWRYWCVIVLGSMLPDIDGIGFFLGVPYGSFWGHRGFTHSLLFALVIAILCAVWLDGQFHIRQFRSQSWLAIVFFLAIASHGVLDAMTNGGLGVAFFSPFDRHRYFLPWRPILVSPIRASRFLSPRGLRIMGNEMLWVWCPALIFTVLVKLGQRHKGEARPLSNGQE